MKGDKIMKKILYPLIIGLAVMLLAACGGDEETKDKSDDKEKTEENAQSQEEAAKEMEELQKKLDKQKLDEDKVVAIVNKEEITGKDFNNILPQSQMAFQQSGQDPTSEEAAKTIKDQTIESLIGQTLLLQKADEKGYKASEEEINKQLDELKAQYEDEKKFEEAMKQAGFSLDQLKSEIAANVKYMAYVEKEITVDKVKEEEIKEFYDQFAKQGESEDVPKYEEVKPQIQSQLEQQKKSEKLAQHVEELKKNADVEVKI
jgi:FKBP-type peptidyl-prolyl cis-trans isomerase (trigger factor)